MKMIQKLKRGDAGTTGLALEKYGKFGVDGNSGVLWYLTQLSTIFQLYRGVSFIGGGNRSTRRKL